MEHVWHWIHFADAFIQRDIINCAYGKYSWKSRIRNVSGRGQWTMHHTWSCFPSDKRLWKEKTDESVVVPSLLTRLRMARCGEPTDTDALSQSSRCIPTPPGRTAQPRKHTESRSATLSLWGRPEGGIKRDAFRITRTHVQHPLCYIWIHLK